MRKFILLWLILAGFIPYLALAQTNWEEELVYRTTMGSPEDVALLMKRLDKPNLTDSLGYPLLYIAATRNDADALAIVKALVENGADVNFDNGEGHYPILAAVQAEHLPITRYLIEQGATHRAKDAAGTTLKEYAMQSRNPELRELVLAHVERGFAAEVALTSQEGLDALTHQLAYHGCALQYYTFYYESGQDEIDADEQRRTLQKHQRAVTEAMQALAGRFGVENDRLKFYFAQSRQGIFDELEKLVSNRWRRSKGVGQPGDMEQRCEKHAEPYKEGVLNAERLLKRKNRKASNRP